MVGPEKRGGAELAGDARLGLERRVELRGYVEHEELAALYRGAACLVFPSRYEGFGLPVLEAMASGTPVVAAAAGAVPEVAGDAAVLVEPGDRRHRSRDQARARGARAPRRGGLERAAQFSWDGDRPPHARVYRELL